MFKATIEVFMDVEDWPSACDCIAETMRDHLKRYAPLSSIVDWQYAPNHPLPVEATQAEVESLEGLAANAGK